MKRLLAVLILKLVMLTTAAAVQAQDVGQVTRLDPALDDLISPSAKIEKLADDFGFLEGPVWVHGGGQGYLIFSDIPANEIKKWTPDGKVSVFLDKSGFTGSDPTGVGYQLN